MSFRISEEAEKVYSSDVYYDLFDGGYIEPSELLEDSEKIIKVNSAIEIIEEFIAALIDADKLEII